MNFSLVLAVIVAAIFVILGVAKILAVPPMRDLAAKAGFSTAAYRRIGALEVAGATGVALGLGVPLLGYMAGAGLLVLLAGALITHARNRDAVRELVPAMVCALLVVGYLVALWAETP